MQNNDPTVTATPEVSANNLGTAASQVPANQTSASSSASAITLFNPKNTPSAPEEKCVRALLALVTEYVQQIPRNSNINSKATLTKAAQEIYPKIAAILVQALSDAREQVLIDTAKNTGKNNQLYAENSSFREEPFKTEGPLSNEYEPYQNAFDEINKLIKDFEKQGPQKFPIKYLFTALQNVSNIINQLRTQSNLTTYVQDTAVNLYNTIISMVAPVTQHTYAAPQAKSSQLSLSPDLFLPVEKLYRALTSLRRVVSPADPTIAWDYIEQMAAQYQGSQLAGVHADEGDYVMYKGQKYSLEAVVGLIQTAFMSRDPMTANQIAGLMSKALAGPNSTVINLPHGREREWLKLATILVASNAKYDLNNLTEQQLAQLREKADAHLKMRVMDLLSPVTLASGMSEGQLALTWLSQEKQNLASYQLVAASLRDDLITKIKMLRAQGMQIANEPDVKKFFDTTPCQILKNLDINHAAILLEQLFDLTANSAAFKLAEQPEIRKQLFLAIPTLIKLTVVRWVFFSLFMYWTTKSTSAILADISKQLGDLAKVSSLVQEVSDLLNNVINTELKKLMRSSSETFPQTSWSVQDLTIFYQAYSCALREDMQLVDPNHYYLPPDQNALNYFKDLINKNPGNINQYLQTYKNSLTTLINLHEGLKPEQQTQQLPRQMQA